MEEFLEHPLLHYPDLVLALLRIGAGGNGTLEQAANRLRHDLAIAHERPGITDEHLLAHLAAARHRLALAGLVEGVHGSSFRTTERGRRVLAANPRGVDDTTLLEFPEFRAHVRRLKRASGVVDPVDREYQRGFAAFLLGRTHADNPHRSDTVVHQAWENGWFEARDVIG